MKKAAKEKTSKGPWASTWSWIAAAPKRRAWAKDPEKRVKALEHAIRQQRWEEVQAVLESGPLPEHGRVPTIASIALWDSVPRKTRQHILRACLSPGAMDEQRAGAILMEAALLDEKKFDDALGAAMDGQGKCWPAQGPDGFLNAFLALDGEEWSHEAALRLFKLADLSKWEDDPSGLELAARIAYMAGGDLTLKFARAFPGLANARVLHGTTLTWAVGKENALELCAELLSQGANPKATDDEGFTPLMRAAWEGDERLVGLLLPSSNPAALRELGDGQEAGGATAWSFAISQGHEEAARVLERAQEPSVAAADGALEMLVENSPTQWRLALASALGRASDEGVARAAALAAKRGHGEMFEALLPRLDPALGFAAALEELSQGRAPHMSSLARSWARSWREEREIALASQKQAPGSKARL